MNSDEAWSLLDAVTNVEMYRWTKQRAGRKAFKILREGDDGHAVYQITMVESGREPRRFDREQFNAFWKVWADGKRTPDDYRNIGTSGGMYKHAYYMLPMAAALEAQGAVKKEAKGEFKYGDKSTWQLAVDAVRSLGGTATIAEAEQFLSKKIPGFNVSNVRPDLDLVTVNAYSRSNWSQNQRPRVVDGSNPLDLLFVVDRGIRTYTLFDPAIHGIWELASIPGDTKLRPRLLGIKPAEQELDTLREALECKNEFDPNDDTDARIKTLSAIARRQGQSVFRSAMLKAYGHCCAFTGCDVVQTLEAAHIRPYLGEHTNVVVNGLLLRSDLHTLFDLRLVRIDPSNMKIEISSKVTGRHYKAIHGMTMRLPTAITERPSVAALQWHWNACASNF